ncbi:MAG: hypothetical protein ACFFCQ_12010 [Promethearchaeota archaeon]
MSGIKVSQDAMESIATILGLTEIQTKVYLASMGIGTATLGQLSQKSGINVLETAEAINDLEKQGLLKKIPGIIARFVPLEPFLRAHTLEFDPVTLLNIFDSIKAQIAAAKTRLGSVFEGVSSKVETAIHQVAIDISAGDEWKKDLSKLEEPIQHATEAMKVGLDHFRESREKMILELKELEKSLDDHIRTSVEDSNQMSYEVRSKLHTTSMLAAQNLTSQVQNLLDSFSSEIRESLANIKKMFKTALQDLRTTKEDNIGHFTRFQVITESKLNEINDKFGHFCQTHLKALENVDEKLNILDNLINNCSSVFDFAQNSYKNLNSATEKLAFLYGDIDGRRLFSGKKETLETINAIQSQLRELESTLARRKEELDISLKNAQTKMENEVKGVLRPTVSGIVTALEKEFGDLQEEFSSEIKAISTQSYQSFEKLGQNTLTKTEKAIEERLKAAEKTLTQSLDSFNTELEGSTLTYNRQVEDIVESGGTLSTIVETWRETQKNLFSQLFKITKARLEAASLGLTTIENDVGAIQENHQGAVERFQQIAQQQTEQMHRLKPIAAAKAGVAIKEVDTAAAEVFNDLVTALDEPISALIFKMKTTRENLETIFNASRMVETEGLAQTYPLVGESSVILFMRDMVRRTKNELEAVMLVPELQTLMLASKLPTRTRVTFVGNWDKVPEARIRKLLESGTIRMKQLPAQQLLRLWLFIRDKEEILIAPEPDREDEELVGIVSTSNGLIRLFTEELSTIKVRSKDLML